MSLLHRLALCAIRLYQRHVSPYKGFSCAYRVHTGRASCSELGWRAIRRHGLWNGLALLQRRTALCGEVHRRHRAAARPLGLIARHGQRGLCDLGCDAPCDLTCDLPHGRGWGSFACDALSCCDCSGWERKRRTRPARGENRYVQIPPNSMRPEQETGSAQPRAAAPKPGRADKAPG